MPADISTNTQVTGKIVEAMVSFGVLAPHGGSKEVAKEVAEAYKIIFKAVTQPAD